MSAELPESALPPPTGAGESSPTPTRRTFIATSTAVGGVVVAGGTIGGTLLAGPEEATAAGKPPSSRVSLTVNGSRRTVTVDNRTSLLDLLREHLDLTGSKKGCNAGA
ncbi:carbon monoxide dehydrogenase, partial [Streptomyces flaveus]